MNSSIPASHSLDDGRYFVPSAGSVSLEKAGRGGFGWILLYFATYQGCIESSAAGHGGFEASLQIFLPHAIVMLLAFTVGYQIRKATGYPKAIGPRDMVAFAFCIFIAIPAVILLITILIRTMGLESYVSWLIPHRQLLWDLSGFLPSAILPLISGAIFAASEGACATLRWLCWVFLLFSLFWAMKALAAGMALSGAGSTFGASLIQTLPLVGLILVSAAFLTFSPTIPAEVVRDE